jgi:glycerol-3-phosphate cytidylyltransferase
MYKVGLVAGAFDLIHPGYIRLLQDSKRVCEYLIVALHEDPSLERPKSKKKPIFTREERAEILMAIRYVDEVRYYKTEDDLILLLLEIQPDIRIIGTDYRDQVITGKGICRLFYHDRNHNWSVTRVRKIIAEQEKR